MSQLVQREKRTKLHLPVEVHGEEKSGTRFTEMTRSLNISGGGICFESHRQLAIGSKLVLTIELPISLRRHFSNRDVVRYRAVVCRLERFEGDAVCRVGARLLGEASSEEV